MSYSNERARSLLQKMTNTPEAIQQGAQWFLSHAERPSEAANMAQTWEQVFAQSSTAIHRLSLVYLVNEMLQRGRPRISKLSSLFADFKRALQRSLVHVSSRNGDDLNKYNRVLDVWQQRNVYDQATVDGFRQALKQVAPSKPSRASSSTTSASSSSVPSSMKSLVDLQTEIDALTAKFKVKYGKFHSSWKVVLESQLSSEIPQLQQLGEDTRQIGSQLAKLRAQMAKQLRQMAQEADDWYALDESKLKEVDTGLRQLGSHVQLQNDQQDEEEDGNDDDEDEMPHYDDDETDAPPPAKRQHVAEHSADLQSLNSILAKLA